MPHSHADAQAPDFGELPNSIGFHLRMVHNLALKGLDSALAKLQLTTAMYGVLELLSANRELPQGVLARCVGLTDSSMVPLADKLEARGLVERTRPANNRRTVCVCLTADGRRCWNSARRIVKEHEKQLRSRLSEAEASDLIRLLEKLTSVEA